MPKPGLDVTGLTKGFAGRQVLQALDLVVRPGEFVAILGESGSGKSTLLNLIAGLDNPDAGEVAISGTPLSALDDDARTRLRRRQLGFVFQAFHILPHLSVGQNVELPLVLAGVPAAARGPRCQAMLAAVGLADRANGLPRELSGGELQRVAVARALVHNPALVLADEPTGNLDPHTAVAVLGLLARQVREQGAAGVLVTHSRAAAGCADRILWLKEGRLEAAPERQAPVP